MTNDYDNVDVDLPPAVPISHHSLPHPGPGPIHSSSPVIVVSIVSFIVLTYG